MVVVYVILMLLSLAALGASYEERTEQFHPKGEGRCRRCGYELDGLPAGACCPECGCQSPGRPSVRPVMGMISTRVVSRLAGVWGLAVVGQAALWPLVRVARDWSYRLQLGHYDPAVIANAQRVRGFDLEWESALLPLGAAVLACAALCLLGEGSRFWRRALQLGGTGWAASVCWLFVETYLTYR